jgi:hypothetical protein
VRGRLTPVILATQEAGIRRIVARSQPQANTAQERPYLKKTFHKTRTGGVAQDEGPEFKPQYWKKKKLLLGPKAFCVIYFLLTILNSSGRGCIFLLTDVLLLREAEVHPRAVTSSAQNPGPFTSPPRV